MSFGCFREWFLVDKLHHSNATGNKITVNATIKLKSQSQLTLPLFVAFCRLTGFCSLMFLFRCCCCSFWYLHVVVFPCDCFSVSSVSSVSSASRYFCRSLLLLLLWLWLLVVVVMVATAVAVMLIVVLVLALALVLALVLRWHWFCCRSECCHSPWRLLWEEWACVVDWVGEGP